jgi:hypothetical protein
MEHQQQQVETGDAETKEYVVQFTTPPTSPEGPNGYFPVWRVVSVQRQRVKKDSPSEKMKKDSPSAGKKTTGRE